MPNTNLEANERLVRRLFDELIAKRRFDITHELLRPDYIQHNSSVGQSVGVFLAYFSVLGRTLSRLYATSTKQILSLLAQSPSDYANSNILAVPG